MEPCELQLSRRALFALLEGFRYGNLPMPQIPLQQQEGLLLPPIVPTIQQQQQGVQVPPMSASVQPQKQQPVPPPPYVPEGFVLTGHLFEIGSHFLQGQRSTVLKLHYTTTPRSNFFIFGSAFYRNFK
ncbi:unnamed protein product [Bursaphelenchus xylophilus]|uniref:(pine wood nematode) hypothetical protein n=1 Tax=Bursaphelenchus xylophilus TaxID=6326 RepID=A0A1I7RUZ1_BURXY|nr:unnamed protein product [Bursaphelenchus xylophilus]CAG9105285.1 unnamed protein product [Bursaphelenchus xylophilus]